AGVAPIGSGIELAGGQNDIVQFNQVYNQGGWGIVVHDFPDTETPPPVANCNGGTQLMAACYFTAFGNEVDHNFLNNNGGFGNPTNGDLADDHQLHNPGNCWHDNTDIAGPLTRDPPMIQTLIPAPSFFAP